MTKAEALAKVRTLIAAATADTKADEGLLNSARNAGLQACRLIKLHGLAVGLTITDAATEAVVDELHRVAPAPKQRRAVREPKTPKSGTSGDTVTDAVVDAAGRIGRRVARDAVGSAFEQIFGGGRR